MERVIRELNLPPLLGTSPVTDAVQWRVRRQEILTLLEQEMYGVTPPPCPVHGEMLHTDESAYGGKAVEQSLVLHLDGPYGEASFPVTLICHKTNPVKAVFINIAFMTQDKTGARLCPSCPIEEIIDGGFALAIFSYTDVASDDDKLDNGVAAVFPHDEHNGWGKLSMWAYGMSRVADYVLGVDRLKNVPLAAIGFSRLGKTALWCGAQDERFAYVMPFGSSTAGVGFTRRNSKQNMEELQYHHSHWFCGNFAKYNHHVDDTPFDQHFPVALCAPRRLLTSIAEEDEWADVANEYMSCVAAHEAYVLSGAKGFVAPMVFPHAPSQFLDGELAFALRHGTHFFSRADWNVAMGYIE